jgi:TolB-like protein
MSGKRYAFGRFVFDAQRATLLRDGAPLPVGSRGLALLHALLRADGRVVTKAELLDAAWSAAVVEESNLSVQVAALRRLLSGGADSDDVWIATVPRVGYRFAGTVSEPEETAAPGIPAPAPVSPEAGRRPSLAVVPFVNRGDDPQQDYFADGLTEDLIAALSRFRWFSVIGRNSAFAFRGRELDPKEIARELDASYLLQGSVRRSGTRLRVSAQLLDASSARHLWAERHDVELDELFSVQDRIIAQVAGAIEPELLRSASTQAAARRHVADATALDLVYQGTWHFHHLTRSGHFRSRALFRRARLLDPQLTEAYLWVARVDAGLVAYGWSDDPAADLREGVDAALDAVRLDDQNPYAHYALAIVSVYAASFGQAIRAAEMAIESSPSFALGHLVLGMALLFSGAAAAATGPLEQGLRLNPHDPQNFVWFDVLALAHLFTQDARRARDSAIRACKVRPDWRPALETLACCHAALGDLAAAREAGRQLCALARPPGDVLAPMKRQNPQWSNAVSALLRQAGVDQV